VPGAFTPTCSSQAPGYIEKYDEFKAKGINEIYILTVNDAFVTKCVSLSTFGSRSLLPVCNIPRLFYSSPFAFFFSFMSPFPLISAKHQFLLLRAWKEKLAPNGTRRSLLYFQDAWLILFVCVQMMLSRPLHRR
jgi:hypothetical protein